MAEEAKKPAAKRTRKAPAKSEEPAAAPKKTTRRRRPPQQKYMRNLLGVPVSVRLSGKDGRRIELAPRGMRGDVAPIQKAEEQDEIFVLNVDRLFEVITANEATTVTDKQATNQQADHPAFRHLRNSLGEEYKVTEAVMEPQEQDRSIDVGKVDDKGNIVRKPEATLTPGVAPERAQIPGTTDRPIHTLSAAGEDAIFDEAPTHPGYEADANEENPLDTLRVSVEPVQRTDN